MQLLARKDGVRQIAGLAVAAKAAQQSDPDETRRVRPPDSAPYTTSISFNPAVGGNGACGSRWYQRAVDAMSSRRGR